MKLSLPFPLEQRPDYTIVAFEKTLAAGASASVVGSIAIPEGVSAFEAKVGAKAGAEAAGYILGGAVKNLSDAITAASGTLTSDATNVSADDTVTIGEVVYTFKASVTTTANEVKVGASASVSLDNLKAAINGAAGGGTTYGSETVAHPLVTATDKTATTLKVVAKTSGVGGNSIASTEESTHLSWGGATLSGGLNAANLVGSTDSVAVEDDSGWACTATVNGPAGTLEIKGTADSANATTFSGYIKMVKLV